MNILEWVGVIKDLGVVIAELADAVDSEDTERADAILGPRSVTSIARAAAEIKARQKYGPRDSSGNADA